MLTGMDRRMVMAWAPNDEKLAAARVVVGAIPGGERGEWKDLPTYPQSLAKQLGPCNEA
jgi:hypothetical protein